MFHNILKVAMASREAVNNAAKAGPITARDDLNIRDAQGISTHPAQKAAISGAAPAAPAPKQQAVAPKGQYDPNVKTLEGAKNPYPRPAAKPNVAEFLRRLGLS